MLQEVYVGTPAPMGDDELQVWSAIRKDRVGTADIAVGATGLDGDRQADPVLHGGPDKAAYVYPSTHYPFWRSLDFGLGPGGFGENLSVAGLDERDVRIGDVFAWGSALVQVSQPRTPCYKLAMHTGRKDVARHMIGSGRCGWYVRVLRSGTAPTSGELRLTDRDESFPTVHALYSGSYARGDDFDPVGLRRMIDTPALADQWRFGVMNRLRRVGAASKEGP